MTPFEYFSTYRRKSLVDWVDDGCPFSRNVKDDKRFPEIANGWQADGYAAITSSGFSQMITGVVAGYLTEKGVEQIRALIAMKEL